MYLTFTLQLLICITDLTFAGLCLGGISSIQRTEAIKMDIASIEEGEVSRDKTPQHFTPVSILRVCAAVFFLNAVAVWL